MKKLPVLMLLFAAIACEKKEDDKFPVSSTAGTTQMDTKIIARARDNTTGTEVPVEGVEVKLYATTQDRDKDTGAKAAGVTGSDGNVTISNLSLDFYYVKAIRSQNDVKFTQTTTPENTITYLDFTW